LDAGSIPAASTILRSQISNLKFHNAGIAGVLILAEVFLFSRRFRFRRISHTLKRARFWMDDRMNDNFV